MSNFHSRLNESCAVNSDVPRFGKGQQTYIARKLGCSQEAVRKWFSGESVPRANMGAKLAKLLDVSYTWLMLGAAHGEVTEEIKKAKNHDAAIYATIAHSIVKNVGVTLCGEEHPADMLIIDNGVAMHVCAKGAYQTEDKGVFVVTFRKIQIKESTTVAVFYEINKDSSIKTTYLEIPEQAWRCEGVLTDGNEVTLTFRQKGSAGFESSGVKLNNFLG
jgi:transcriptional regulator with XRE-family HTH domain